MFALKKMYTITCTLPFYFGDLKTWHRNANCLRWNISSTLTGWSVNGFRDQSWMVTRRDRLSKMFNRFLIYVFVLLLLNVCAAVGESTIYDDIPDDFDDLYELLIGNEEYLDLSLNSTNSEMVRRIPIFKFRRRMSTPTTTVEPPRANTYSPEFLASANDYNISNRVLDIFYFSRYCGPGDRVWGGRSAAGGNSERISYADLDECCRQHDECPNYIRDPEQYGQFPGLEYRNQYFSRYEIIWIKY